MSAPGELIGGQREVVVDHRYYWQRCDVVVLATSRHRRVITAAAGAELLDVPLADCDEMIWRSVITAEIEMGFHDCSGDDCEPGSWCVEGQGRAWVLVLYPPFVPDDFDLDPSLIA